MRRDDRRNKKEIQERNTSAKRRLGKKIRSLEEKIITAEKLLIELREELRREEEKRRYEKEKVIGLDSVSSAERYNAAASRCSSYTKL